MRVCGEPGCGVLFKPGARGTRAGRCPDCTHAAAKARGTRTEQGWGWPHQQQRAAIQQRIDAGEAVTCWSCGVLLIGHDWHLDHNDDRTGYEGPACIRCNLSRAGKKSRQQASD